MAARSVEDQINTLLSRRIAEDKTQGAPTPDVESAALFESVAIHLLLNPRTALFAAHTARNGLIGSVQQELSYIAALRKSVQDTGNKSYAITNTTDLSKAKVALLQMEDQQKINPGTQAFKSFSTSIDSFLNNQLAKNVKKKGSAELVRPSSEAAQDFPSDLSTLKTQHSDVLDRLYSLAVGVDNLMASSLSSVLGASAAGRARRDIEAMIANLQVDSSGASSRDNATALISSRAALKALGSPPPVNGPVVDSATQVPPGFVLQAYSGPSAAKKTSSAGPFVVPTAVVADYFTVNVNGTSVAAAGPTDLAQGENDAAILGAVVSWPVVVPATTHLFLKIQLSFQPDATWVAEGSFFGKVLKVTLNDSTSPLSMSLADVITAVNTALGAYGSAVEFVQAGTNRLLINIIGHSISVAASYSEPEPSSTVGLSRYFTLSAHQLLGLQLGQAGTESSMPAQRLVDALNILFGSLITASRNQDESINITSLLTNPGLTMTVTGSYASAWVLDGVIKGTTNQVFLKGTVNGVQTDPVNPSLLLDVGDSVSLPVGISTIAKVSDTTITLAGQFSTFSAGNLTATSALVKAWLIFQKAAKDQATLFLGSDFNKDLSTLDRAISTLVGQSTAATRSGVLSVLADLETRLNNLITALSTSDGQLPVGSATEERSNATTILNSMAERKYDRAADFFNRCKLKEIFSLDYQSASYGGTFLAAASTFAQTDVSFPNTTKDGSTITGVQDRRSTT